VTEPATRHGDDCECTRCRGFQPGHELSIRHGARAVLHLRPRAAELAETIRDALGPTYSPRFELAIAAAAAAAAQYEKAMDALLGAENADELVDLERYATRWARLLFTALSSLGLTPLSASKLGWNLAEAQEARARLESHVRQFYGGDADVLQRSEEEA
jgi:hypothetical protein